MRLTKRVATTMIWLAQHVRRDLAAERAYWTVRCLYLEAAQRRAECERDDWAQIARALARKFEGMDR